MKVALYARARVLSSISRQEEEDILLENQINEMKQWVERGHHEIFNIYTDAGFSSLDESRPAYRQMMNDVLSADHPFDAVLVVGVSRLFRQLSKLTEFLKTLQSVKVSLISITETTNNELIFQCDSFFAVCDELLSRENRAHIRRSKIENAKQGYFNGSQPPFGYMAIKSEVNNRGNFKRKLVQSADEAKTVRLIFRLAIGKASGKPLGSEAIAKELNSRALKYRGLTWVPKMVWNILNSSTYYGEYVFNRFNSKTKSMREKSEWVITKIPPIVSKSVFDQAEASRAHGMY